MPATHGRWRRPSATTCRPPRSGSVPSSPEPLRAGLDASAYAALVSGSGPTCLFLCGDPDHAAQVAAALAPYGRAQVCHGPVAGATVLDGAS